MLSVAYQYGLKAASCPRKEAPQWPLVPPCITVVARHATQVPCLVGISTIDPFQIIVGTGVIILIYTIDGRSPPFRTLISHPLIFLIALDSNIEARGGVLCIAPYFHAPETKRRIFICCALTVGT